MNCAAAADALWVETKMATTTINNTTVVFSNAGVASADVYNLTDGSLGIATFNVMANDGGGAKAILWSLDDGIKGDNLTLNPLVTTNNGMSGYNTDLLYQDAVYANTAAGIAAAEASTTTDRSANGAKIWISADGQVKYDASTLNASFLDNLHHLHAGQYATDTFQYTIRLANGTLSVGNVTVQIAGVNDGPVLSDTTDPVAVSEATDASAQNLAAITGNFSVTDLDIGDTLTASVVGSPVVQLNGSSFALPAGAGALTAAGAFTLGGPITSNGGPMNIGYTYDPSAANLDFLRQGDTLTVTYTIKVNDGTVDSGTQNVTFTITGTNDAPVITSNAGGATAAINVAENSTAVTTVTATDLDAGATQTYSIAGGADAGKFTINSATGELKFISAPDAESKTDADHNGVYEVTVQVSDGIAVDTQAISVTVTDVNDNAPVVTTLATQSVNENAAFSVALTSTDADTVGTNPATFTITGGMDAALFSIDGTGHLTMTAKDFENATDADHNNTYVVEVTANDGANTTPKTITVTVNDVNDVAPTITSGATATEAENTAATNVVYDANATDPDTVGTVTFSLTGDDAAKFSIDSATGEVRFLSSPNFEAPTDLDGNNVYDVVVHANDGVHDTTKAVAISVTDVNDVAPVITTNASQSVNENTAFSVALSSTDVDTVGTNPATFTITGGADSALFSIDGSGNLTMTAKNFESPVDSDGNNTYVVQVTANDGANTTNRTITVTVNNVNEAPVITSNGGGATASINVAENTTAVTTVAATDPDAATTLTYSIVGGADQLKFAINSSTGALTFVNAPDFENPTDAGDNNVYDVIVRASDGSLSDDQAIAVTVTNVNEAPTAVVLSNTVTSTPENGGDVKVADISITDDALGTNVLSLSGADAASFSLVGNELHFNGGANFEAKVSYNVTVNVNDASVGGNPDASQSFALSITNVNEVPTITSNGAGATASVSIPENTTAVTTVTATDPDAGTTLSYSIVGGADAAKFAINSSTGVLTFVTAPDFEAPTDAGANNVYDVTVRASDGTLFDDQAIAVTVTDVVESVNHAPIDITLAAIDPSNGLPASVIGTLSATDPDVGDTFTYSLLAGSSAGFSIAGNTLNGSLSNGTTYTLDIQAQDSGTPTMTFHEVFNIITGNGNADTLPGGGAVDPVANGDDVLYGLNGADMIFGASGNDTLFGQGGNDTLSGGDGNDFLYGGDGKDSLNGGTGADHFAYSLTNDSAITYKSNGTVNTDTTDTITGFNHVEGDTIDFSAIAGVTSYAGQLLGSTIAAHSVGWVTSGGNTTVYVNSSNAAETITAGATYSAEMEIHLTGVTSLTSSDFLLHS